MPDTIAELCEAIEKSDSQSSLFKKADATLRAKLVEALIRKSPWTYHDCFQHFELDRLGISFTAFYYWARRVRRSAALIEMARSCDAEHNPVELVPRVLAFRLLDASLDDDAGLTALNRLTRIYQAASNVEFARRRMDIASHKADAAKARVENSDLSRLCQIVTGLQRKNLRAEFEKLRKGDTPAREEEAQRSKVNAPAEQPVGQVESSRPADTIAPPKARVPHSGLRSPSEPPPQGGAGWSSKTTNLTPPRKTRTVDASSEISNREISNSPAHESRDRVMLVKDRPRRINPVPSLPDPLAPRIDLSDLPDPDPRREALRQRIREDMKPLLNLPDSS